MGWSTNEKYPIFYLEQKKRGTGKRLRKAKKIARDKKQLRTRNGKIKRLIKKIKLIKIKRRNAKSNLLERDS